MYSCKFGYKEIWEYIGKEERMPVRKNGMKKRIAAVLACFLTAVFVCMQCSDVAYAYFNRGTVTMSLGKQSVSLEQGASENISISFSPASDDQLPGCGMAECPQICGEKECLDENYNCCCNGTTYTTYYAYATVSSSNTSVATATYDNGVVTVKGVGSGTATITLTASLRQFTSSTQTMEVTVTAASTSGSSSSGSTSGSSSSGSTSGSSSSGSTSGSSTSDSSSVGVTQVTGTEDVPSSDTENTDTTDETAEVADETGEAAETEDEISVIESDKGTIWFVPITGLAQGKDQFEQIIGQESYYVDFQMKDASDTVLYAWEFCGADVTAAEDMIFTIESSTDAFDGCSYGSASDSLYLAFGQEGDFVGDTSVYMQVDTYFGEDDLLNLYQYDAESDEVTLLQEGLELASGYVTMELAADEGGQLILTTQTLENIVAEDAGSGEDEDLSVEEVTNTEKASSSHRGVIAAIVIIIVIIVILVCVLVLRKRKKAGSDR